ncbi:PIN family toxin-antitoxin system [Fusobacterium vincentii]|nr:PIN family toxin-antitoxin system [Fusobacterium vincentii]
MLAKFLNDKKLTFAANSLNLLTSQLQTQRDLLGSLALIFYLKFRMQVHLFLVTFLI